MSDISTEDATLEKIADTLETIEQNTRGGGGGGGFSPITQDGDTITIPMGHIDATMQQTHLNISNKRLIFC